MSNGSFVFLDLEFLDYMESAAIISMGVVVVDFSKPYTFKGLLDKGIHVTFDYKDQIKKYNRTFHPDVVSWWKEQSGFAKKILSTNIVNNNSIMDINSILENYIYNISDVKVDENTIWMSRGSIDYSILRNCYVYTLKQPERSTPWKYYNTRDIRTALHFMVGETRGKLELPDDMLPGFVQHNALHDVCSDVMMMQEAFKMAGILENSSN